MKKFTPNGGIIKKLRLQLERFSTQKEFCHEIGVSERMLRQIENNNANVTIQVIDRIAKVLGVHRAALVYSLDSPKIVSISDDVMPDISLVFKPGQLVERYDYEYASATMDEGRLFQDSNRSHDVVVIIEAKITSETADYVEELINVLTGLSWSVRSILERVSPSEEIAIRRRIRQLLVLLKGNDIWVYETSHFRRVPERHTVATDDEPYNLESRTVIAFGPPGEYGETSLRVSIDHGQPFILPDLTKGTAKQG